MKRTCRGTTEAASSRLDRERPTTASRRQRLDRLASQEDQLKHGPQHPSEDTIEVQGVAASHVFGTGLANVSSNHHATKHLKNAKNKSNYAYVLTNISI